MLQPNFRGSYGYGDAWFQKNGFKSWRIAIGDVLAGGHWLVSQGIADPAKLGICSAGRTAATPPCSVLSLTQRSSKRSSPLLR